MDHPRFTIILPTRERADTLRHALRTCTEQDYENLEIIVADNMSRDDTRDVVEGCGDPRVRYVNPGRRLSMSHNWEFALSHVRAGFVTALGDDDGILPGGVLAAREILAATGLRAVAMNPTLDSYFWPGYFRARHANLLKVSFLGGTETRDGEVELRRVLACERDYHRLPMLYYDFVDTAVVDAVKARSGAFFRSQIPDVYSGVAIARAVGRFAVSRRSLRLVGASSHSTGTAILNQNVLDASKIAFLAESNIPFHASLPFAHSLSFFTAECFLQSFDAGLNADLRDRFDVGAFLRAALREADAIAPHEVANVRRAVAEAARRHGLSARRLEGILADRGPGALGRVVEKARRYSHPFVLLDASAFGASNIYDACRLHAAVRLDPASYLLRAGALAHAVRAVLREVRDAVS